MKNVSRHNEKWYNNSLITSVISLISLIVIILLIVLTIQTFGQTNTQVATLSMRSVAQDINSNTANTVVEAATSKIVSNDETDRQFGTIKTHLFDIVDTKTEKVIKLNEAKIPLDQVEETINEYLKTSKYKTLSIGVVDNKLYIQQDTSIIENKQLKTKIISIMDEFTADSWFKLTEAVLSSSDVQAMSLFSYQTDNGNKHLIYIFKEK